MRARMVILLHFAQVLHELADRTMALVLRIREVQQEDHSRASEYSRFAP